MFSYLWKPLLVPARADDESYQLPLLKPTQRQLRALAQEVKHFIQGKWTLSRHRDKCWGVKRPSLYSGSRPECNDDGDQKKTTGWKRCVLFQVKTDKKMILNIPKYLRYDLSHWQNGKYINPLYTQNMSQVCTWNTYQVSSVVCCLWTAETWLTFSLNLKHTDGVLWREVPELAGGECVSSLSQGADHPDGRLQKEGLEERWATDLLCHDASIIQDRRFWFFVRTLSSNCFLLSQPFPM